MSASRASSSQTVSATVGRHALSRAGVPRRRHRQVAEHLRKGSAGRQRQEEQRFHHRAQSQPAHATGRPHLAHLDHPLPRSPQQRRTARPNRKSIEIPVVANIAKVVGSPTRRVASHTREQARAIAGAESCRDGDGAASCAERAGLRLQGAASPTDRPPPDAPAARGAGAGDECRAEGGEAAGAGDGARDAARDVGRCVLPEVFPTMSEVVFQRTSFLCAFVYSLLFVWLQQGGSSCGSSCCST